MNKLINLLYFLITLSFFNGYKTFAQTFPFTSGIVPLCDTVYFTANVSGVNILQPPGTGFGSTLTGVEININSNHPQTLKVTLTSPVGTNLLLAEYLGAGGSNYVQTNFIYTPAPSITTGTPPFTGNFLAQGGSLSIFDGEDPNGSWTITIVDTACFNIPPGGTGGGPWTPGYFNGSASADGGIAIGGNAGPLPINLISLTAQQENNNVIVEWVTATEVNNHFFDIEKGSTPDHFTWVGKIYGNGTTSNINYYTFIDENPNAGLQYYRLKQTDYDGNFEYFGPIAIDFKSKYNFEIISAFTSLDGNINLIYNYNSIEYHSCVVYDLHGKQVYSKNYISGSKGNNHLTLNAPITSGVYLITLFNNEKSVFVKFLK